jgi:hypothetical protein
MKKPGPPKQHLPPLPPRKPPRPDVPPLPPIEPRRTPNVIDRNLAMIISVVLVALIILLGWLFLW